MSNLRVLYIISSDHIFLVHLRVSTEVTSLDSSLQTKQETLMACGMSPSQPSQISSSASVDRTR